MTTKHNDREGTERLRRPPTDVGSAFRISDIGTTDSGVAISAIRDAFEDCFGELALVVESEYGNENTYSFEGSSPIYCCHVPKENHDPDQHGPQTVGFRYSYQFIRDIGTDNPIQVVEWTDTRFTDVEEVVYP